MKPKKNKTKLKRTLLVLATAALLLWLFPVYNLLYLLGISDFYSAEEKRSLIFRSMPWELAQAQPVMEQAERAFSDLGLSWEEAEEKHGPFRSYCFRGRSEIVSERHSLKLLTAHFYGDEGRLWVFFSQEAYNAKGELEAGGWHVPSLWKLEKQSNGSWVVVSIREHP